MNQNPHVSRVHPSTRWLASALVVLTMAVDAAEWQTIPGTKTKLEFAIGTVEQAWEKKDPEWYCEQALYKEGASKSARFVRCRLFERSVFVVDDTPISELIEGEFAGAMPGRLGKGRNRIGPLRYQTFVNQGAQCVYVRQFAGFDARWSDFSMDGQVVAGDTRVLWWYCDAGVEELTDEALATIFVALRPRK